MHMVIGGGRGVRPVVQPIPPFPVIVFQSNDPGKEEREKIDCVDVAALVGPTIYLLNQLPATKFPAFWHAPWRANPLGYPPSGRIREIISGQANKTNITWKSRKWTLQEMQIIVSRFRFLFSWSAPVMQQMVTLILVNDQLTFVNNRFIDQLMTVRWAFKGPRRESHFLTESPFNSRVCCDR